MLARSLAALTAAAVIASGAPVQAAKTSLFDRYFGKAVKNSVCYARVYPTSHFRKHPRQTVKRIWVLRDPAGSGGAVQAGRFEVRLGIRAVDDSNPYTSWAYCREIANRFNCSVEADGGQFRLTPNRSGGLTLTTGGVTIEGAKRFLSIGERGGDDRTFTLPRGAGSACS